MLINLTKPKASYDQLLEFAKKGTLSSLIIESSDDAIKTKTLEGIITSWNHGAEKIYGYKEKEIIGKHINMLIPPKQHNELEELLKQISTGHDIPHYETKRIRKDGVVIDVSLALSPIKDKTGKIIGAATVSRDITGRNQASKYARSLIEASLDPLVILGTDCKITDMNEAMANLIGVPHSKLTGTDIFVHFTDPKKARELCAEVFAKGSVLDIPFVLTNKDRELTPILFNGSVYKDDNGNVLGVVIVVRAVTAKKTDELNIANKELAFQNEEKEKRADELVIANKELAFQDKEKVKRADELIIANKELVFQNEEKEKRAAELIIANRELLFQNEEKEKRAAELIIANKELLFQNEEKEKRANELIIANKELAFQDKEKGKRADELIIANKELLFQNEEKEKRANELSIANEELAFQNEEKEKRAAELIIANKELVFQNNEKEKRAAELFLANEELIFQTGEKEKRAAELVIADIELDFQNKEKEKREIANKELEILSDSAKQASLYARSLIEASTDPLVTISPLGKITDVNEASVNVTGVSREILIGTDFSDYFTEPVKARDGYKKVFEQSFVSDYPLTIRHKNGKLTDVLYNASVYKDDKGNVLGVFAAARDVTAQKLLSKYSLSLIEASLDPLVTISIEGKITDMNEATANITGMTREELTGTDFFDYFTDTQKAREVYQEVFAKGSVADSPLTLRHKAGKLTDVLFNGSVYKDDRGNVLGVVIVARDVTEQKRIARELTEAKELAEKLAGAKDQFLASMSHEIRTPLNGIIGFTKILLRNDTTDVQKHQLDAIKTSSDILLVLINDILDLAKIEAGKMNIETTELKFADLINSVLGSFELRFQEKELKMNKQYDDRIPKILIGDPVRINQILLNLLSNSVKFTENGGQISTKVKLLSEDEEKVNIEITISDTGIGISPEKLGVIFQPFIQSSNDTARKYGGTGLGLSIVNQLVDLMGGSVKVNSELSKGSSFVITLPLKKTTATEISNNIETKIHSDELARLGELKILLVEDIPINQFLAQTILHDFGFKTDTAENGKIAIELLEKKDYDIILMDLMMPEMNGFEATWHIRNKMSLPKSITPIIALTADVTKADVDKCTEVGMNEYVSKPINESDLLNKITRLVNKRTKIETQMENTNETKICNLDYLKSHSPNNPKFVAEMLQMFLKQTPANLLEISRAIAASDWSGVHGNIHKIRPSIDLIGMPKEISAAAKEMEEYCKAQTNLELVAPLFLKVETAFHKAYIELAEELKGINSSITQA